MEYKEAKEIYDSDAKLIATTGLDYKSTRVEKGKEVPRTKFQKKTVIHWISTGRIVAAEVKNGRKG